MKVWRLIELSCASLLCGCYRRNHIVFDLASVNFSSMYSFSLYAPVESNKRSPPATSYIAAILILIPLLLSLCTFDGLFPNHSMLPMCTYYSCYPATKEQFIGNKFYIKRGNARPTVLLGHFMQR